MCGRDVLLLFRASCEINSVLRLAVCLTTHSLNYSLHRLPGGPARASRAAAAVRGVRATTRHAVLEVPAVRWKALGTTAQEHFERGRGRELRGQPRALPLRMARLPYGGRGAWCVCVCAWCESDCVRLVCLSGDVSLRKEGLVLLSASV